MILHFISYSNVLGNYRDLIIYNVIIKIDNMKEATLEILCDPISKKSFDLTDQFYEDGEIINGVLMNEDGEKYEIFDKIPNLMPEMDKISIPSDKMELWEKLQNNGNKIYEKFPDLNCSTLDRKESNFYREFCSICESVGFKMTNKEKVENDQGVFVNFKI